MRFAPNSRGAVFAGFLLLAAITGVIAAAVGTLTAYVVVRWVMEIEFRFSLSAILQGLLVAIGLVMAFGLRGTWRVLGAPVAPHLRSE